MAWAARVLIAATMLVTGTATADAQGWLLGKRHTGNREPVKVTGKYRSHDRIHAYADGGDFGGLFEASRAVVRQLAELARARDRPRFAITSDRCSVPLASGVDCWADATMLDADAPVPAKVAADRVFRVADVLEPR